MTPRHVPLEILCRVEIDFNGNGKQIVPKRDVNQYEFPSRWCRNPTHCCNGDGDTPFRFCRCDKTSLCKRHSLCLIFELFPFLPNLIDRISTDQVDDRIEIGHIVNHERDS